MSSWFACRMGMTWWLCHSSVVMLPLGAIHLGVWEQTQRSGCCIMPFECHPMDHVNGLAVEFIVVGIVAF